MNRPPYGVQRPDQKYVILDLDNCIADDSWRIGKINFGQVDKMRRYHDYHLLAGFDNIGNEDLFDHRQKHNALIFTARPVFYRAITEHWLMRKGIVYDYLLMRNDNNHNTSETIKQQMLDWLPALYGIRLDEIVCAYDDRPEIVDMYKRNGLAAEVRCIHNVCAYTDPITQEKHA